VDYKAFVLDRQSASGILLLVMNEQKAVSKLKNLLLTVSKEEFTGLENISVSFSGGVDSSAMAFLAKKAGVKNIQLVTTCLKDSFDVENSRHSAELLGLEREIVYLDDDFKESVIELGELLRSKNPMEIGFMLPYYVALKHSNHDSILLGQGADEIFGGYKHLASLSEEDFDEKSRKITKGLLVVLNDREYKMARKFDKEAIMPLIDARIVEFALSLPKSLRAGKVRKHVFREAMKELGLPGAIADKPKKAAQYGSGVMKKLKKMKAEFDLEWTQNY